MRSWSRQPLDVAILLGRCLEKRLAIKPGRDVRYPLIIALIKVKEVGLNRAPEMY